MRQSHDASKTQVLYLIRKKRTLLELSGELFRATGVPGQFQGVGDSGSQSCRGTLMPGTFQQQHGFYRVRGQIEPLSKRSGDGSAVTL